MKIVLEFTDAAEREKVLSTISFTLQKHTSDLVEVENILHKHLEDVVKIAIIQGGLKKEAIAREPSLIAVADDIFKSAAGKATAGRATAGKAITGKAKR